MAGCPDQAWCSKWHLAVEALWALMSYSREKKTMESEKMVFWLTFVAFFTAGNRLRSKNGKKLWILRLEYQQHIRWQKCDGYGNLWLYPNWHATGFNGREIYGHLLAASQTTYVTCNWILWNIFRWVIQHIKNNIKLQIKLQGLLFLIV